MWKPLHDSVIVTPIKDETVTASGIKVVQEREQYPEKGVVVSAGPGRTEKRRLCPMEAQPGDEIYFVRGSGAEMPDGNVVIAEGKIIATIRGEEVIPYWDKVLIALEHGDETLASGLVLPGTEKGYDVGTVLAVGPGYIHEGDRVPMALSPGDKVAFTQYMGTELDMSLDDDRLLFIVREYDVYYSWKLVPAVTPGDFGPED